MNALYCICAVQHIDARVSSPLSPLGFKPMLLATALQCYSSFHKMCEREHFNGNGLSMSEKS